MAIGTYISIINLNVNGKMLQPEDTDWLKGYKHKTHIYAVYKKPTSDLKTHIDWKWEDANGKQKKAGLAILLSDKIDLKI